MDLKNILNEREPPAPRLPAINRGVDLPRAHEGFQSHSHGHNHWGECTTQNCHLAHNLNVRQLPRQDSMAPSSPSPPSAARHYMDHSESLPRSLPCYKCRKLFTRRSDLVRHERIHSGIRPHACGFPNCGKSFIQRSALTIHERVHTGDKPHACKSCGKLFSDSSSLARHRRTHTGVRPYRCDFPGCGKDFTRKTTLSRHRQQHLTKGHVPVAGRPALRSPVPQAAKSDMSSYPQGYRHDSAMPSPTVRSAQSGPMYITFQVNQAEEQGRHYEPHAHMESRTLQPPPLYRAHTTDATSFSHKPAPLSIPSPAHDGPHANVNDDYFSRHRVSVSTNASTTASSSFSQPLQRTGTANTNASSYNGSPLPRIVSPGWEDDRPRYGPLGDVQEIGLRKLKV